MKNKKLVVALAAVVAAAGAISATSTYAWFTTTRTATVNVSNVQAYARGGNLTIEYVEDYEGNLTSATKTNAAKDTVTVAGETTAPNNSTDVSGNGLKMYLPNWKPGKTGTEVSSITDISATTANSKYYISFGFKMMNSSDTDEMKVYLDADTNLTPATDTGTVHTNSNISALGATRIAILDSTKASVLWKTAGLPVVSATTYDYIKEDSSKTLYKFTGYDQATDFGGTNFATPNHSIATTGTVGAYVAGDALLDPVTSDATNISDQLIATVPHNGSVTVYVRIWMEGTSEYCVNNYDATSNADGYNAVGGKVNVKLALAAL